MRFPAARRSSSARSVRSRARSCSAWAVEGDLDPATAVSNTYEVEWPPRSGHMRSFPEIDRVEWFGLAEARERLKAAQAPFLDRLEAAFADAP